MATKLQIVQEIRMEVYGGMPSEEARISERFILRKLNEKAAEAAVRSAYQLNNLEGVTFADDSFYYTYNDISLSTDTNTGFKFLTLPAAPIGLPRQRAFQVFQNKRFAKLATEDLFKPIARHEVSRRINQAGPKNIIYFYQEGKKLFFLSKCDIIDKVGSVNLSVISVGSNDLTEETNMPPDMVGQIKAQIVAELRAMMGTPQDLTDDGRDITQPR